MADVHWGGRGDNSDKLRIPLVWSWLIKQFVCSERGLCIQPWVDTKLCSRPLGNVFESVFSPVS